MKQLTLKINSQVMNQLVYRKLKILTLSQMESFTFQGVEEDGEKRSIIGDQQTVERVIEVEKIVKVPV